MHLLRLVLVIATAVLAACGGGDRGGGSDVSPATSSGASVNSFSLSSTSVTFNGTQGGSVPGSQYIQVDWWTSSFQLGTSQTGPMFAHNWTYSFTSSPKAQIEIRPAYPSDVGTFTGTITVKGCLVATPDVPCIQAVDSPRTISVTYNVLGLSVKPAQLTFSSTGTNPEMQTVTLAATAGGPSYTWQVSYSPSATEWLQITPSSGTPDLSNGPQTLMFNVNAAGLRAGVYSATVAFSAGPTFRAPVTVTLFVGDPSVNFVGPYVVPAGAGGNVIIRGRGFSALNSDSLSVQFNSTSALTAAVVSDTEIRATYPPLAAGSYSISVSSGATSIPSRTALKLVVIDPPAFPFTSIARPASAGWPENLIYDAERQALLFTDPTNNRILRYALSDGGSTASDTGSPVGSIALSPDGTELIRAVPPRQLIRLNPVTLAVLSSVDILPSLRSDRAPALAFGNDGGAITSAAGSDGTLYRYDMLTQAFTPISSQGDLIPRPIFASADGGTLVLPYPYSTAFARPAYTYSASTGALTARWVTSSWFTFVGMNVNRNASRIILADTSREQTAVYDREFKFLGTLPSPGSGVAVPFVLSPDGDFAYAYYSPEGRVRKFNISAPGAITEVGSGSVVMPAKTAMSQMTISPDGGTLFLVGTTSVVITPTP
jgi:hypothetical protein